MATAGQLSSAMTYWGAIQSAVAERATTGQIWDAIRADAAAVPGGAPLPSFAGVNAVRSMAAAIRNSSEALAGALDTEQRTGLAQGIDSSMMALAPWSRDATAIATMANYQVRFQASFQAPDGSQFSQWLTMKFDPSNMPGTVGELADALDGMGASNYTPAGGEYLGADSLSITVV